jgi:predicted flap endonuclease-1-like 5' DNA nuclease
MLQGAEPWATWFYPLAWYPTLALAELWLIRRRGRGLLRQSPHVGVAMLGWSVPFWLLFELFNFRVQNWYYVFVPHHPVERWAGITLSFATVLPAVFVFREVMAELGLGAGSRWRELRVANRLPEGLQLAGIGFVAASLAWPLYFFPLVWGAMTLLFDPWVYRRDPGRSLLGALEKGRPGVVLQLLAGGLAIGFLWELYNAAARGKWIYTVPGLEELKVFEMPLLGFLGFPVLALDAWVAWNALRLLGLAPGCEGVRAGRVRALAIGVATALCVGVPTGMERWTITSTRPVLAELVGDAAPILDLSGYDAFSLARSEPSGVALAVGVPIETARRWVERAQLVTLRGIGVETAERLEAAGVPTVHALAAADADALAEDVRAANHAQRARVRIWVEAAREATGR